MMNEFVVGQNHFTFNFANPSSDPTKMTFSPLPLSLSNPQDFTVGNLRTINTYQFVDNLSVVTGGHNLKFGINFRYQVHTGERGSVAGQNVAPIANFSTGVNTVDPATFGIPTTINTTFDRPNMQSAINLMLGRIGQISQGFVQAGNASLRMFKPTYSIDKLN